MKKQKHVNRWFWKWHIIAGLITIPFILLLSVTGIIYLFKEQYNNVMYDSYRFVATPENPELHIMDYNKQLLAAYTVADHHIAQVILPEDPTQAIAFRMHGKKGDHTRNLIYVNPYTAEVTGQVSQRDTLMYKIRKLHGELLLNTYGTYVVELVASWFLVLIVTGLYVWWPSKRFKDAGLAGFFTVRIKSGKHTLYRDLHAVGGFWLSIVMVVMLSGGMPWTEFFGDQLKWVQNQTDAGYPKNWGRSDGLASFPFGEAMDLNHMIATAKAQQLKGTITLKLPVQKDDVLYVSNRSFLLRDQRVIHIDQYSGDIVKQLQWNEVGILMELRQLAMRFHQGEYGFVNKLFVLLTVLIFAVTTAVGLLSYLIRKPKGRWGLPKVPSDFSVGYGMIAIIVVAGIIFPLFGASVALIMVINSMLALLHRRSAGIV